MKKTPLCAAALLCVLFCAGCVSQPGGSASGEVTGAGSGEVTASKLDNIPFAGHHDYAVAYLGYQEIVGLDDYVEQYLDSDNLPTYFLSSGDYYLVIPRYPDTALSLYQDDIETGELTLLVQDPDCRPFVIQCNASDIFADAVICLTHGGETTKFSPCISLKDGSVDIGPQGLDITSGGNGG